MRIIENSPGKINIFQGVRKFCCHGLMPVEFGFCLGYLQSLLEQMLNETLDCK